MYFPHRTSSPWFCYDLVVRKEACNLEQESHRQFGVGVEVFPVFFLALTVGFG